MGNQVYDDLLFQIASEQDSIESFLDVIFDFLRRRSDFFHVKDVHKPSKGFVDGEAYDKLRTIFTKHQLEYNKTTVGVTKEKACDVSHQDVMSPIPPRPRKTAGGVSKTKHNSAEPKQDEKKLLSLPHEGKSQAQRISTWNGGKTDTFWWSQTLTELCLEIQLPHCVVNKNDIQIELTSCSLQIELVEVNQDTGTFQRSSVLPLRDFHKEIKLSDSVWCIEDCQRIVFSLEKAVHDWWPAVFLKDDPIDLTQLEQVEHFNELDLETKVALEKAMYEYTEKLQGKHSAQQTEMQTILRKAWNVDGSPFKNTPFDPNLFM